MAQDLIRRYGTAGLFVSVAFICTLFLQRFFSYPFLFLFFAAVMASAWFGGAGAGLFAVLASTVVVAYFFVPPYYSWAITPTAVSYFAAFVACALVASWVSSGRRKTEEASARSSRSIGNPSLRAHRRAHADTDRTGAPVAGVEHGRAYRLHRPRNQPATHRRGEQRTGFPGVAFQPILRIWRRRA